jgi:hypothetical protein
MKKEIIYTDDYALIISDEQAKENDWGYIPFQGGEVKLVHKFFADDWRKIIAHRPLKDRPVLEGVPLLPEFSEDGVVNNLVGDYIKKEVEPIISKNSSQDYRIGAYGGSDIGFRKGYNKAKETYKYTEDDLVAVWNIAFNEGMSLDDEINEPVSFKDVIKSLQQPKRPKYFESEMEKGYMLNDDGEPYGFPVHETGKPKTIVNSQCQTELVGEYIY